MKEVGRRALVFTSRSTILHNDDGSVTTIICRALDCHMRTAVTAEFAVSSRLDKRWLVNATMKYWHGSGIAAADCTIETVLSSRGIITMMVVLCFWMTLQRGITSFIRRSDMATQSISE